MGEGGAGRVERATVSVGQHHHGKPGQLLRRYRRSTATIWGRTATTQPSTIGGIPTRVRWAILRRTGMGFTTWPGMCLSGVGIGMGRRMVNQRPRIQPDRHQGATVFCAAAIGATTPTTRGAPIATTPPERRRRRLYRVPLCEGALVFALLRFNPFEENVQKQWWKSKRSLGRSPRRENSMGNS